MSNIHVTEIHSSQTLLMCEQSIILLGHIATVGTLAQQPIVILVFTNTIIA